MPFHWLWAKALTVMWTWEEWKRFIENSVTFSHDSLHVIVGVVILLGAGLVLQAGIELAAMAGRSGADFSE